jgi:hypothetical protein
MTALGFLMLACAPDKPHHPLESGDTVGAVPPGSVPLSGVPAPYAPDSGGSEDASKEDTQPPVDAADAADTTVDPCEQLAQIYCADTECVAASARVGCQKTKGTEFGTLGAENCQKALADAECVKDCKKVAATECDGLKPAAP